MNNYSPAGFFPRFLAYLNEFSLFTLVFSGFLSALSRQNTLESLFRGFIVLLVLGVFFLLLDIVYGVLFTHYFGGTLGKLITGLRVRDLSGNKLAFNKILFRQLISYRFSGLLFGLGYLSILKDENKQAWHDKTVNSNVFKVQSLLPLALLILILTLGTNGYLLKTSFDNFNNNPVKDELLGLVDVKPETSDETPKQQPFNDELTYTQQDVENWKQEVELINLDRQATQQLINNPSFDQAKVQSLNILLGQMKGTAERIYGKMSAGQVMTPQDAEDVKTYGNYILEQERLVKELSPLLPTQ